MTPEQEILLMQTVTKVGTKMDMLVSDDGSRGQVPELAAVQVEQGQQISYWKGAIAVMAFVIIVFGGVVAAHILGGK